MAPAPTAKEIVYDFAEIHGQLHSPIRDVRLLPHPKRSILDAFARYQAELSAMQRYLPEVTDELGKVYSIAGAVYEYQEIDREDMAIVMEINTGRRFARFRENPILETKELTPEESEDYYVFMDYFRKYFDRGLREQGLTKRSS